MSSLLETSRMVLHPIWLVWISSQLETYRMGLHQSINVDVKSTRNNENGITPWLHPMINVNVKSLLETTIMESHPLIIVNVKSLLETSRINLHSLIC